MDCYSHYEDRYLRIGNRLFYEDPDQAVEPSAQIVVAHDAWARELARNTLTTNTPTLFCTPDGQCSEAVELRPSRDLVSDPAGHPTVGRPENVGLWLRDNPDMEAIDGRTAHRLFMTICQFPAMRASWLREIVGGSSGEVSRHLKRFVDTGLVAVFDGRHYLSELGMRRAANMSRVLPSIIRSRHGAYLDRWYREHEELHNDGVNRLVVRFAREGVETVAGWRGEVNVPGLTQVRPDLLVQVSGGALDAGTHCIEFERTAVRPERVAEKLGPYRRMAAAGRALPLLMVCETALGQAELPGRRRDAAHADHHPGAGAGRAGHRRGYGVEPGRGAGGAALPVTLGKCGSRLFHNRRLTPVVAPQFGHVPPSESIGIAGKPTGQRGGPGRPGVGGQQSRHQAVNLVPGQRHVPQHQAGQPGQGEPRGRRRVHQPDAGVHRLGQQPQQLLEGEGVRPGGVGDKTVVPRAGRHRQVRQVPGMDGLDLVIAAPEDGEDREPPQRPGHVVQQQIALAEDQGGPDDGVGDTHILKNLLHLTLAPEVGQPALGRCVGHREVDYPAHAGFRRRSKQNSGVFHRLVEGVAPPPNLIQ